MINSASVIPLAKALLTKQHSGNITHNFCLDVYGKTELNEGLISPLFLYICFI